MPISKPSAQYVTAGPGLQYAKKKLSAKRNADLAALSSPIVSPGQSTRVAPVSRAASQGRMAQQQMEQSRVPGMNIGAMESSSAAGLGGQPSNTPYPNQPAYQGVVKTPLAPQTPDQPTSPASVPSQGGGHVSRDQPEPSVPAQGGGHVSRDQPVLGGTPSPQAPVPPVPPVSYPRQAPPVGRDQPGLGGTPPSAVAAGGAFIHGGMLPSTAFEAGSPFGLYSGIGRSPLGHIQVDPVTAGEPDYGSSEVSGSVVPGAVTAGEPDYGSSEVQGSFANALERAAEAARLASVRQPIYGDTQPTVGQGDFAANGAAGLGGAVYDDSKAGPATLAEEATQPDPVATPMKPVSLDDPTATGYDVVAQSLGLDEEDEPAAGGRAARIQRTEPGSNIGTSQQAVRAHIVKKAGHEGDSAYAAVDPEGTNLIPGDKAAEVQAFYRQGGDDAFASIDEKFGLKPGTAKQYYDNGQWVDPETGQIYNLVQGKSPGTILEHDTDTGFVQLDKEKLAQAPEEPTSGASSEGPPLLDETAIEAQKQAWRAQAAASQARAMQAMMERGARAGVPIEAMMGQIAEAQHRGGLAEAQMEAEADMEAAKANLANQMQQYQNAFAEKMWKAQNAASIEERDRYYMEAKLMQDRAQAARKDYAEFEYEMRNRNAFGNAVGDAAGGLFGGVTDVLGRYFGAKYA